MRSVEQFSAVVCELRQSLPSSPWVSKGWEPLVYGDENNACVTEIEAGLWNQASI